MPEEGGQSPRAAPQTKGALFPPPPPAAGRQLGGPGAHPLAKDSLSWKNGKRRRRGRGEGEGGRGRAGLLPVLAKICCHLPPRARSAGTRGDARGCAQPPPPPRQPHFALSKRTCPRTVLASAHEGGFTPKGWAVGEFGAPGGEERHPRGAEVLGVSRGKGAFMAVALRPSRSVHKPQVDLIN